MNTRPNFSKLIRAFTGVGVTVCVMAGCKPSAAPPPGRPPVVAVKPVSAPVATNSSAADHLSVFEDLTPPQGRDPFYPESRRREPVAAPLIMSEHKTTAVASDLLLKGIVGSATHRLAVINNEILEVGEEARVRVPSGQVRLKVVEIGDDYAVIKVDGEARTQRLVMDKKNY